MLGRTHTHTHALHWLLVRPVWQSRIPAGRPSGEKIVVDARLQLAKAVATHTALAPFIASLGSFRELVVSLPSGVLTVPVDTIAAIDRAAVRLASVYQQNFSGSNILEEFRPTPSSDDVLAVMGVWTKHVWQAQADVLRPILRKDLSANTLATWSRNCGETKTRIGECVSVTARLHELIHRESSSYQNSTKGHAIIRFLVNVAECLRTDVAKMDLLLVKGLQKSFKESMTPFCPVPGDADTETMVQDALLSPFFALQGTFDQAMSAVISEKGSQEIQPFLSCVHSLLGNSAGPVATLDLLCKGTDALEIISNGVWDVESHEAAMKWAADTSDNLLQLQMDAAVFFHMVRKELAVLCMRSTERAVQLKERVPGNDLIKLFHIVRSSRCAFNMFLENNPHVFDPAVIKQQHCHLSCLDDALDLKSLHPSVESVADAVGFKLIAQWNSDVQSLINAIAALCPEW